MVEDLVAGNEDTTCSASTYPEIIPMHHVTQEANIMDPKAVDGSVQTEVTALLNSCVQQPPEPPTKSTISGKIRQICACPPQGMIAGMITNVAAIMLIWAVAWSITGDECLPGGNLFGILFLFFSAVIGGKIMGLIKLPGLPPFPPLLGMLLIGFLLRNVPFISGIIRINAKWGAALRNIALSIILARAGLGLDSKGKHNSKYGPSHHVLKVEQCRTPKPYLL